MSNLDKNIIITPNVGANGDPQIVFSAANTTANAQNITMRAYPTSNGTLSVEGSAGQLFSITNQLTGTLFSVNDISGIPSIQVQDTGQIQLAPFGGYVTVSANVASNSNTTGSIQVLGGIGVRGNVYADAVYSGNVLLSSVIASNVIYISGIDTAQNARMTIIESTNASQNIRLDYSNTAITIAQGVDNSQNVRLDYSNAAITIIEGTNTSQNSRMTIIEGVDATQNTNIANKLNLTGSLNQTVSGNVTINQDLIVAGNLIITGNINSQNVQQLAVADPLIVLGIGNYVSDTKDIGFAAHYNDGTNAHAGLIRDSGTKEFYIFQGYTPELDANNNVIITDPSFRSANLNANVVKANLIASNVSITSTITSTSNTTGALVVAGGIGTAGPIYSTGGSLTINNGLATTGNSGTIFLGDGQFTKTYGGSWTFNGGVTSTGSGFTAPNVPGLTYTGFTFSGTGQSIYQPSIGVVGITANSVNAFSVSAPAGSVNYLNISAAVSGASPTITAIGPDASVSIVYDSKNSGQHYFRGAGGTQFSVQPVYYGTASVNYLQVQGNSVANTPLLIAAGSDTNVSLTIQSKGNSAINFATANGINLTNGGFVTSIVTTSGGGGYPTTPTITFSTPTSGGVTATANAYVGLWGAALTNAGSGYTLNDVITFVGGVANLDTVQYQVTSVNGTGAILTTAIYQFHYGAYWTPPTGTVSVTGGTGTGASFSSVTWTVYGINLLTSGSGYVEQPTITIGNGGGSPSPLASAYAVIGNASNIRALGSQLNIQGVNGSTLMKFDGQAPVAAASTPEYLFVQNTQYGRVQMLAAGSTNSQLWFGATGAGYINFTTRGTSLTNQFRITDTPSAVNYAQVTGNTAGNGPYFSAQGTDTNIDLNLLSKGTGNVVVNSGATGMFKSYGTIGVQVNQYLASGLGYDTIATGAGNYGRIQLYNSGTGAMTLQTGFSTGYFSFQTNNAPSEQFRITNTASAVNYITATGSVASGYATLNVSGSDTYRNLRIQTSTGGAIDITRGYSSASSSTIGIGPVGGLTTDTAGGFWRGLHLYAPNYTDSSGNFQFPRTSQYFEFNTLTNPTVRNYFYTLGNTTVSNTINFIISNNTGGDILFNGQSGNSNDVAFKIVPANVFTGIIHANYIQVTGGAAGSGPSLTAQGTDGNAGLLINSKGAGDLFLRAGTGGWVSLEPGGSRQFAARNISSAANYLTVWGSIAAGNNTTLSAEYSSSANVAINLVPKGNAAVMITGNTTGIIAAANSIYVGDRVGYANANNISVVYQSYNSSTNSLDVVFG